MIQQWGAVTATADGEDSAGRHKWRKQTAEELVTYAFDVATEFYSQARARGLMIPVPELEAVEAEEEAREAEKAAAKARDRAAEKAL